jgi:hypothetical protein
MVAQRYSRSRQGPRVRARVALPLSPIQNLRTVVGARVQRTVNPSADAFQGSNP